MSKKLNVPPLLHKCTRILFSGAGSDSMAVVIGLRGERRVASEAVLKNSGRERMVRMREVG
jgi:hypothetical protein